jgi:hypothetical protein
LEAPLADAAGIAAGEDRPQREALVGGDHLPIDVFTAAAAHTARGHERPPAALGLHAVRPAHDDAAGWMDGWIEEGIRMRSRFDAGRSW